jgi:hypothetical protein
VTVCVLVRMHDRERERLSFYLAGTPIELLLYISVFAGAPAFYHDSLPSLLHSMAPFSYDCLYGMHPDDYAPDGKSRREGRIAIIGEAYSLVAFWIRLLANSRAPPIHEIDVEYSSCESTNNQVVSFLTFLSSSLSSSLGWRKVPHQLFQLILERILHSFFLPSNLVMSF